MLPHHYSHHILNINFYIETIKTFMDNSRDICNINSPNIFIGKICACLGSADVSAVAGKNNPEGVSNIQVK